MKINAIKKIVVMMMLLGLGSSLNVSAHDGATGVVKQRMEAMSDMGDAMKAMASMVKGKQAFEPALFIQSGETIAKHSDMIPQLFPLARLHSRTASKLKTEKGRRRKEGGRGERRRSQGHVGRRS